MQIRRLRIDNYGPLRDCDWELDPGMTLFYGENESGKTLLVESVIKLLLDGNTSEFEAIDRVTGNPAGFLLLTENGKEIQIPEADYTDLFPNGTEPADIRNAFVIRDFDLRIPNRQRDFGQSTYFRDVTDRVMGSRTQEIESVQEEIASLGNLANKDSSRIMNRQPEKLKDRYETAHELISSLDSYLHECRENGLLGKIREKRVVETELDQVFRDIQELKKAKRRDLLETGQSLVRKLARTEKRMEEHEERGSEIETYRELKRAIDTFREAHDTADPDPRLYRRGMSVIVVLFVGSLLASILSPVAGLGVVTGILLVAFLVLGYKYYGARRQLVIRERHVEAANYAGIEGDELPTVYSTIIDEIEQYEAERKQLSQVRSETIGNLKGAFEADHQTLDEWEQEISRIATDTPLVDREFDPGELQELETRRDTLRETRNDLQNELATHRDQLTEFDRDVQVVRPGDYLEDVERIRVQSVEDLQNATDILQTFVSRVDRKCKSARAAIDIFQELAEEEEQEINQLLTEDDFVIKMVRDVTAGNYTDVWYDEETGLRVRRTDDQEFSPFELSQGTYDLLYLTIRLKLAQQLLGDTPGFLILDDAFIHSDATRAAHEIAILDELVSDGWQVVYFSFREAVRDAISASPNGSLIHLDGLDFTV